MKDLLESDYIVGHNISSRGVMVVPEITDFVDFDLKDDFPIEILPLGMGQLSIHNEKGNLEIIHYYCCPLKVSEQRDIHPQCCCNGIADDFSEGKPLS